MASRFIAMDINVGNLHKYGKFASQMYKKGKYVLPCVLTERKTNESARFII